MSWQRVSFLWMLVGLGIVGSSPVWPDGLDSGAAPYERCALCHGLFGNTSRQRFPKLAGQNPDYLERQILDFIEGRRSNDGGQMVSVVTEIERSDIAEIVEWFSSQDSPEPYAEANASGELLFASSGCQSCHTDSASEGSLIPLLSSQHPDYLVKQLQDFKAGRRDAGGGLESKQVLADFDDQQIVSIAQYLSSVRRAP